MPLLDATNSSTEPARERSPPAAFPIPSSRNRVADLLRLRFANFRVTLVVAALLAVVVHGLIVAYTLQKRHAAVMRVLTARLVEANGSAADAIDRRLRQRVEAGSVLLQARLLFADDAGYCDHINSRIWQTGELIDALVFQAPSPSSSCRFSVDKSTYDFDSRRLIALAIEQGRSMFSVNGSTGAVNIAVVDHATGHALVSTTAPNWLGLLVTDIALARVKHFVLADDHGTVLVSSDDTKFRPGTGRGVKSRPVSESSWIEEVLASDGSSVIVARGTLGQMPWTLHLWADVAETDASGSMGSWLEVTGMLVALQLPLTLILILMSQRILKPIERMKAWAKARSETGNLVRPDLPSTRTILDELFADLDRMADRLDLEMKSRSLFFAAMSHEIRTPINAVVGFGRLLLQSEGLTEEQREQLLMIRSSGESLMVIINDLLDFGKLEAGRLSLMPELFRPSSLMKTVVAMMGSIADGKGVALRLKFDGDSDAVFIGDESRLRQILVNLIGNALKFTSEGAVVVNGMLSESVDGSTRLVVVVVDTGIGMTKEAMERLFDAYSQANIEVSRAFGGTGLGLALCKQLVELMQGSISVEIKVNVGSSFTFSIPIKRAASGALVREAPTAAGAGAPANVRRILLAEDQFINQRLAIAILTRAGHEVVVAGNGVEAVARASEADFDIVLMDIQMPEMDGIAATKAIRNLGDRNANVPIVAVTAQALPEEVERCLAAGMIEYVTKPIDEKHLLAVVDKLGGGNAAARCGGASRRGWGARHRYDLTTAPDLDSRASRGVRRLRGRDHVVEEARRNSGDLSERDAGGGQGRGSPDGRRTVSPPGRQRGSPRSRSGIELLSVDRGGGEDGPIGGPRRGSAGLGRYRR